MRDSEIFIANKNSHAKDIEIELAETLKMVESSLILMQNELIESIICPYQNGFLQLLLNQMRVTLRLYRILYEPTLLLDNSTDIFLLNVNVDHVVVRTELVASIHQLQSLCYFAAYKFFEDLDSNTVNGFTVINKYMLRTVKLIDLLDLSR